MNKSPIINSSLALIYIIIVVLTINFVAKFETNVGLAAFATPIIMLSILVLSVSVMAYLFFFQPLKLFLDGKKDLAVKIFLSTIINFAILIIVLILLYLLII